MILQRLAEHYERIKDGLPRPGYSLQKISFCVVLNADGSLNQFKSELQNEGKASVARPLIVPGQAKPPGQGINPCFLWDNAAYMLGWSKDEDKQERAALSFAAFRQRHLDLEPTINDPAYAALCTFLRNWTPEMALLHSEDLEKISTNFGVFKIAGQTQYLHDVISLSASSKESAADSSDTSNNAMCLISGKLLPIARLHDPAIKGVAGAQSSGALIVSFNAPAYESYGKSQSFNAPVSSEAVFKYANTLNALLADRDHRVSLGDSTVVFWAEQPDPLEEVLSELFSDPFPAQADSPQEDPERLAQARLLLTQLREGTYSDPPQEYGATTKFFLLGLSPNASRLSVRLWVEADATELRGRLASHIRDIALDGSRTDRLLTLWRIAEATGRWDTRKSKFDTKLVSPKLAGDLARSVLTGAAYPQTLLATMIRRIHSDSEVAYARVAAIKACLTRNARLRGNPLENLVMLDPAATNAAYNCGRLFALLEKAQTDSADGELNTTIKDRYFSSASSTPALVFPRLFRLSQHHLAKLSVGLRISYDRNFGLVMQQVTEFPRQLSLEDQGKFVIGYFHQRQDLYTSKREKQEGENA